MIENIQSSFFDKEQSEALVCSFTGHRNVKPEHKEELSRRLAKAVEYLYSRGVRIFYAGGAVGFDTMASAEVIRFRLSHPSVELRLMLPCTNQDEFWNDIQRSRYEYILANANSVEYVTNDYEKGCMQKRNRRLAEVCDVLVAYVYRTGSGSSQTVNLAKNMGKTVYNISPNVEQFLEI